MKLFPIAALVIVVVCASRSAVAKIVIMEPPIVRVCDTAPTLPKVLECLKAHGLTATLLRSLDDARLFAVWTGGGRDVEAYVLYVHSGKEWKIGGMLDSGGSLDAATVLRLEKLVLGTHRGYRFDIASTVQSGVSLDQMTSTTSIYRSVQAVFCSGRSYSCTTIVPTCSMLVFGQAYQSFAGTLALGDNKVTLAGAGTTNACSAAGEYNVGF